jgi:hypothetical protein
MSMYWLYSDILVIQLCGVYVNSEESNIKLRTEFNWYIRKYMEV